jgi:hypothetical protein
MGNTPEGGFGNVIIAAVLMLVLVIMGGVLSAFGSYIYSSKVSKDTVPSSGT